MARSLRCRSKVIAPKDLGMGNDGESRGQRIGEAEKASIVDHVSFEDEIPNQDPKGRHETVKVPGRGEVVVKSDEGVGVWFVYHGVPVEEDVDDVPGDEDGDASKPVIKQS